MQRFGGYLFFHHHGCVISGMTARCVRDRLALCQGHGTPTASYHVYPDNTDKETDS